MAYREERVGKAVPSPQDRRLDAVGAQPALLLREGGAEVEYAALGGCRGDDDVVTGLIQRHSVRARDHIVHQHLDLHRVGGVHPVRARIGQRLVERLERMLVRISAIHLRSPIGIAVLNLADVAGPVDLGRFRPRRADEILVAVVAESLEVRRHGTGLFAKGVAFSAVSLKTVVTDIDADPGSIAELVVDHDVLICGLVKVDVAFVPFAPDVALDDGAAGEDIGAGIPKSIRVDCGALPRRGVAGDGAVGYGNVAGINCAALLRRAVGDLATVQSQCRAGIDRPALSVAACR